MTVPLELFANDLFDSTLSAGITSGALSLTLTTGQGTRFPAAVSGASQSRIRVDDELMVVTARSGDTLTITRGAEGTTPAAHSAGAVVKQVVTEAALERWVPEHVWQPRHYGLAAWAADFTTWPSSAVASTTNLWLTKVLVPEPVPVSNWNTVVATAGSGVTAAYGLVYDASGSLIAQTAQQSTVFNSTGSKQIQLSSGLTIPGGPGVFIYLGFMAPTATTAPALVRPALLGGTANPMASASDYRGASVPLGGATTPLASFTPGTWTSQPPFWMGLS